MRGSIAEIVVRQDVDSDAPETPAGFPGLTESEAGERLRDEGWNELPTTQGRSARAIVVDIVREPMVALLVSCALVYLLVAELQEAVTLLVSVLAVVAISLYQTNKTERALDALRELSSPRALVVRDGRHRRISGREVVRGDLVFLSEGDRVPADGVTLWSMNLRVDESALTGESVAVSKVAADEATEMGAAGGEASPYVFSGTLVVGGQGCVRVKAIGLSTALGRIGKALQTIQPSPTNLEREIAVFVRFFALAGFIVCAGVAVVYGTSRGNWVDGALAGLALAMSLLPEEFPVILTLFFTLGAWRLAQHSVLTRRTGAIEAIGAATVACVDKTGTLTQNRMAIAALSVNGSVYDVDTGTSRALPEAFHSLIEFAVLSSRPDPFDPMERAILDFARAHLGGSPHLHDTWQLERQYALSVALLAMSHAWSAADGAGYVVAAKGAPEAIADLCHLDAETRRRLDLEVQALAGRGLRVIAIARAELAADPLPAAQHDFPFELLGLLALIDPIRPGVPEAIAQCHRAGIRPVMVTGDYPETARSIAAKIGLATDGRVITGQALDELDDAQLAAEIRHVRVFARVRPEQKLRLVNALKADGEVVAMTGDGVNDAPALKAADIGIAMGQRGTDVAREAAAVVLLDDDFTSIVRAVRLGRRIFENIRKAVAYVLAMHVPIAGLAVVPVLLDWPLILLPIHIVFLELVIDPACSIAFEAEPEEPSAMDRPPRNPQDRLFNSRMLAVSFLQGAVALLLVLAVLIAGRLRGDTTDQTRTIAFSALILLNLGLILANRSWSHGSLRSLRVKNRALRWVVGGALSALALATTWPPVRSLFHFSALSLLDVGSIAAATVVGIGAFDALKRFHRHGDA